VNHEPVTPATSPVDIPPDLFEALVAGWTEILYVDYIARHPERAARPENGGRGIMLGGSNAH
jgi:hypothetical protein